MANLRPGPVADARDIVTARPGGRMLARTTDRDKVTSWQTRQAQYDAVCRRRTRMVRQNAHELDGIQGTGL